MQLSVFYFFGAQTTVALSGEKVPSCRKKYFRQTNSDVLVGNFFKLKVHNAFLPETASRNANSSFYLRA